MTLERPSLTQRVTHRVGGLAAHAGEHVGVRVECYDDGGVAQELLDELGVDVPLEQERRAGVGIGQRGYGTTLGASCRERGTASRLAGPEGKSRA